MQGIDITRFIEKHGKKNFMEYLTRTKASYAEIIRLFNFYFMENPMEFDVMAKELLVRFNREDRSGGFYPNDYRQMLRGLEQYDLMPFRKALAGIESYEKAFDKNPYGYVYIELYRLCIFTLMERGTNSSITMNIPYMYSIENGAVEEYTAYSHPFRENANIEIIPKYTEEKIEEFERD